MKNLYDYIQEGILDNADIAIKNADKYTNNPFVVLSSLLKQGENENTINNYLTTVLLNDHMKNIFVKPELMIWRFYKSYSGLICNLWCSSDTTKIKAKPLLKLTIDNVSKKLHIIITKYDLLAQKTKKNIKLIELSDFIKELKTNYNFIEIHRTYDDGKTITFEMK